MAGTHQQLPWLHVFGKHYRKSLSRKNLKEDNEHLKNINHAGMAPGRICFQGKIVTDGGDIPCQIQYPKRETGEVKGTLRIFESYKKY